MKKIRSVCPFALLLTVAFAMNALAQKPVATQLNRDLTLQNESTEIKRFVQFADALRAQPDALGIIFVYGGPAASAGETDADVQRSRKYLVEHLRMDTNRINIIDGGNRKTSQKEFWIVPPGADEPMPSPTMPPPAIKIDQYTAVNEEIEMARLDNYVIVLQNQPDIVGYIIVYGGRKGNANDFNVIVKRKLNYLVKIRGADPARLVFIKGGPRTIPFFELWTGRPGSALPVPQKRP